MASDALPITKKFYNKKNQSRFSRIISSPIDCALFLICALICFYIFSTPRDAILNNNGNGRILNNEGTSSGGRSKRENKANAIFDAAKFEFAISNNIHTQPKQKIQDQKPMKNPFILDIDSSNTYDKKISSRPGVIILGMHRSGTSMLAGLLVTGMKYNVGSPLIQPASDNERGFFERIDVVLQNDEFFKNQNMDWSANIINYNWEKALQDKDSEEVDFSEGKKGLGFLNDESQTPWLQKDPRMCIALKTWLQLITIGEPAVVFTYRHPLEVARSLIKRTGMGVSTLEHGLRLWIVYNMRAVENSRGLCRVLSSNEDILHDPLREVQRIADELTNKCKVKAPPKRISQSDVDLFVDQKLHHNTNKGGEGRTELARYGSCVVYDYEGLEKGGNEREKNNYMMAMKMYCDFQNGEAYDENYEWPRLV